MNIRRHILSLVGILVAGAPSIGTTATFDGAARLSVADTTQSLTWHAASGALTVSCWVKFSIPTGVNLTENMMILTDRNTGTWSSNQLVENHSYAIYWSSTSGNIEFSSRGPGGYYGKSLVQSPFLERWYHLAVVRNGSQVTGYVDGRRVFFDAISVGDSKSTDGMSIGGIGTGMYLRGEVQEAQVFRYALDQPTISDNRFQDLVPGDWSSLMGYYKLAYSADPANLLRNHAASPATGTNPAVKSGTGTVGFEETSRDGEQSLFDSKKNGGKDAITPLAGGFDWSQSIFTRPTPGVPFEFAISYSSGNAFNKVPLQDFDAYAPATLGDGWRHSFEIRVLPNLAFNPGGTQQALGLMIADGSIETWDYAGSAAGKSIYKTRHKEYRGELEFIGSGPSDPNATVRWITPERLIYDFRSPNLSGATSGRLKQIRDLNGNHLDVTLWETGEKAGAVKSVTDTSGGIWDFSYNAQNRLQSVSGLGWAVTFTYDANNRLSGRSITGPAAYTVPTSTTWQFLYTTAAPAGLLYLVKNPRNLRDIEVSYDKYGRKISEVDGMDRITTFQYNVPALRQMTTTRQAAASPNPSNDRTVVDRFDRKLRVLNHKDAMGFQTGFEYDDAGNLTAAIDSKGNRTTMTYDSRANVLTTTDPLGRTTRREYNHVLAGGILHNEPTKEVRPATEEAPTGWENRFTYDVAGNLLTHTDDIGTLADHTYDSKGLVTSSKDGRGNESRFGYNTIGCLTSRTIAYGTPQEATWTITPNELGWPLEELNPLNEPTRFAYNLYGQVVRTEDAIGRIFTKTYDANGNLTEQSDGNGLLTTYHYNNADERDWMTNRLGSKWEYGYNWFGELISTKSPLAPSDGGNFQDVFTNSYDFNGRLVKITDPYNDFVAFEYDSNGNQTASIDKLGKRCEKDYDALDRIVAERDPEGNIRGVSFDAAGRIKVVTTPNGHPSTHEYDGRSRLKKWTDAEGYRWIYTYDGVGNIEDIEDALGGHYVMTYGPRNERLTELNQDQKSWTYTYDPLVRLKTQLDPNGTHRTLTYDEVGRLSSVEFQTGRINSLGYDNNNNVRSVIRTQPGQPSTALYLDYDDLDRLIESRDTFSKTVRYSYDVLSRIKTKTYPGGKVLTHTYDRLGRVKGLSFAFSASQAFACSFTYDKVGRITGRSYPNGITQTNGFDDAGRINSLDYKTSGGSSLIALGYAYDRNGNKVGGSEQGTLDWQAGATPNYDEKSRFTPAGKLIDRTDEEPPVPKVMEYTYDDSGNMKRAASLGETYDLTYDEDNRTTSIHWENGMSNRNIVNRYDALGRRVSRNADGIETRYVLDLAGGMERILCDTDSSGNILAWYVHGADLCFKVTNSGALTCYHSDAMGNVVRTTDGTAATVNQYAYTPYGRSLDTADNAPDTDPYRFVGSQGVMLELPGLYFMRARYYSAEAGVFLATDPIKNIGPGWKPEQYAYTDANPLSLADSNGESPHIAVAALIGAAWGVGNEGVTMAIEHYAFGKQLDGNDVISRFAGAAVGGAITGALVGTTGGLGAAGISAAGSAADEAVRQWLDDDEDFEAGGIAGKAFGGFVAGGINIGNNGSIYAGAVRGRKPETLSALLLGSHTRNAILNKVVFPQAGEAIGNGVNVSVASIKTSGSGSGGKSSSISSKTNTAASYAIATNSKSSTKAAAATTTSSKISTSIKTSIAKATSLAKSAATSISKSISNTASSAAKSVTAKVRSVVSKIKSLFKRK